MPNNKAGSDQHAKLEGFVKVCRYITSSLQPRPSFLSMSYDAPSLPPTCFKIINMNSNNDIFCLAHVWGEKLIGFAFSLLRKKIHQCKKTDN